MYMQFCSGMSHFGIQSYTLYSTISDLGFIVLDRIGSQNVLLEGSKGAEIIIQILGINHT